MFRAIPVANKLCFDKDLKRQWQIHQQKLKKLKCSIDHARPSSFDFLNHRAKKEVLAELRNAEITRQNRVLLQKINDISLEGDIQKFLRKAQPPPTMKKTLNEPLRKRELVKIVEENQDMLKRIQERKSCYNNKKMAQERLKVEKNIHLISAYPYKQFKRNKTQVNLWMTNTSFQQKSLDKNETSRKIQKSPEDDLTMSKTKVIDQVEYNVSSMLTKDRFFLVELQNVSCPTEKYCLQLNEEQARNFLKTYFKGSLQKMLDNLVVDPKQHCCYLKYEVKSQALATDKSQKSRQGLPKILENSQQMSVLEDGKDSTLEINNCSNIQPLTVPNRLINLRS